MEPKTFRLNEESVAALDRLAKERNLSQTGVVREALSRFLAMHDAERRQEKVNAAFAMRTFELIEEDLGTHNFPEGERSWYMDGEEIVVCIGDNEFHLLEPDPRKWLVLNYALPELASGEIKDGRIEWTPRTRDRGGDA